MKKIILNTSTPIIIVDKEKKEILEPGKHTLEGEYEFQFVLKNELYTTEWKSNLPKEFFYRTHGDLLMAAGVVENPVVLYSTVEKFVPGSYEDWKYFIMQEYHFVLSGAKRLILASNKFKSVVR